MIVSDDGTKFTSNAMFAWAQDNRSSGISSRQQASARVSTGAGTTSFSTRACSLGLDHGPDQDHELGCSTRAQGPQNPPKL